jgi:hypothetical protein
VVHEEEIIFLKAFEELASCRQIGFSLGPIPWRDALRYGEILGLDDDVLSYFIEIIRRMDNAYLAKKNEEDNGGIRNQNSDRPVRSD